MLEQLLLLILQYLYTTCKKIDFKMEAGICYIKKEYLVLDTKEIDVETSAKRKHEECNSDDISGSNFYKKENKKDRKRGQNKNRPVYKEDRTLHLCHSLIEGPTDTSCPYPNCRYIHDLEKYLQSKGEDLGPSCPIYDAKGHCPRGITCRYSKAHTDADGRNFKSKNGSESQPITTFNGITSELQLRLRNREYDFKKSKELIDRFEKTCNTNKNGMQKDGKKDIGCAIDTETGGGRNTTRKQVNFAEKLILAPLTTVGNLPFRRICKEFGADITCSEMTCAVPMVKGLTQEWALTKRHETEDIFGVQICGSNPLIITQVAQLLQETTKVDYIDLNIGCPIDLIYQQGGGSALMRRTKVLELTVRSCAALSPHIPFTVKMRTGIHADKNVAHELLPLLEEWGAGAVTLHGRSREQRYTKIANWAYIEECATKAKSVPIIGNGDILSYQDYNEKRRQAPHVSSIMIGRGALIKPWLFTEIKKQQLWTPSSSDRFEMLRKFCNYGLEHWGSDTKGVETTRRFLLEWQSFLYRYVPDELLVTPPQKINERPQKYRGRDELETLMSSNNSTDWVKLSEMLLGSVPNNFIFVPKHKANAYKND